MPNLLKIQRLQLKKKAKGQDANTLFIDFLTKIINTFVKLGMAVQMLTRFNVDFGQIPKTHCLISTALLTAGLIIRTITF